MKKILLFSLLFIVGCGQLEVKKTVTVDNIDPHVAVIVATMKDVTESDCDKLYKIFSGLALYVEQTPRIDNTLKVTKIVLQMEADFSYDKGQYKDFSSAVLKFLNENEGVKLKKIVDTVSDETKERARADVVKDLRVIAQAAYIRNFTRGK